MNQQVLFEFKDDVTCFQEDFLRTKSLKVRKTLGQFFTRSIVSDYMASLLDDPKSKTIRILDAGAGTGILTASTALHYLNGGYKTVHAVLYELDSEAIINLERTLKKVRNIFKLQQANFTYDIYCEDFVLARPDKNKSIQPFDVSVINPPYFKYSAKASPYAKAVADLYQGEPNIYASFMAIVLACLKDRGQMVTITPRSFTNGLYFKGFRTYLLSQSSLDVIHIFKHRDKVFNTNESSVLQENIICHFVKGGIAKTVTVRSSNCDETINSAEEENYPINLIIDSTNNQQFIRIPESADEARILNQAETLKTTFQSAGYFISTGRIVEHRTRDYINEGHSKHTIFNSSFMDKYFRCISGNTQVNATEIRLMKFPERNQVKEIGRQVQNLKNYDASEIDLIVNPILGVMDSI